MSNTFTRVPSADRLNYFHVPLGVNDRRIDNGRVVKYVESGEYPVLDKSAIKGCHHIEYNHGKVGWFGFDWIASGRDNARNRKPARPSKNRRISLFILRHSSRSFCLFYLIAPVAIPFLIFFFEDLNHAIITNSTSRHAIKTKM